MKIQRYNTLIKKKLRTIKLVVHFILFYFQHKYHKNLMTRDSTNFQALKNNS